MLKLNIDTNKTDKSSDYYCIHSVQKLNSKFDTHVLSTNVPIKQILKNRDIYLVDDLRGDAKWSMNKIIQRNISSKRVLEITNEYLKNNTRLIKFFPAITVVLLPKSNGQPLRNYEENVDGFNQINGINVELNHKEDHFIEDLPVGLSWDKNKISALVIDGQHRVSAIRKFYDTKSEESYAGKSIPVSYIIFDNSKEIDLIQATRALFIDVNNTPRLVSEEKLIFIDDRNLHRRITLKAIGGNDPEEEKDDVYQKIYDAGNLFIDDGKFINTFFLEEAGNDDESRGGLFSTHNSLMPWEFSKLMTIHKNLLSNILLKYVNIDKSRDIRSFCKVINNDFLLEIEGYNSPELLTEQKTSILYQRMSEESMSGNEIEVFKSLISLREKYIDNLINIRSQFMIGTSASEEEKKDRDDFIKIITNIYDKDCSKDSSLEFSSVLISNLLEEKTSVYTDLMVYVFNNLWFLKDLKNSIIKIEKSSVFDFISFSKRELKSDSKIRSKTDKVDFLLKLFKKSKTKIDEDDFLSINQWANNLEKISEKNLLRSIVGQEMLFLYLTDHCLLLKNFSNIEKNIKNINSLGEKKFFDSDFEISIDFKKIFTSSDKKSFAVWSDILMKGNTKKPGLINAQKGADLINLIVNNIKNREDSTSRELDKTQRYYGTAFYRDEIENIELSKFDFIKICRDEISCEKYVTSNDIHLINSIKNSSEEINDRILNIAKKIIGGFILETVVKQANSYL
jgi:hypothetical protein